MLTDNELIADAEKVKAILNITPEDPRGVLRLNGIVNHLSRFLPHMADVMRIIK